MAARDLGRELPRDCATCKHRRVIEHDSPALMVGVKRHHCRKFARSERGGHAEPLFCSVAYDTFCGGGDYSPEMATRLVRFFTGRR